MTNGTMTTKAARILRRELAPHGFDVLYGHGQAGIDPAQNLGKLRSWFGSEYKTTTMLADLDIAVVVRATSQMIALIEIEETTTKPKVLLGDALATLLGSHITFQGNRELLVGPWTTLIVLAHGAMPLNQSRIAFLEHQVNQIKDHLTTPNANIRRVIVVGFENEMELEQTLSALIQEAVIASKIDLNT